MSSYGKNIKNLTFKDISNPLFPLKSKNKNSGNYYSSVKINIKADVIKHNKKLNSNNINTNLQHKKLIDNSPAINNSKLSTFKYLDFSTNLNENKVLDKFKKNNTNYKKHLSANKTNINLELRTTREFKNNLNILPENILENSQNVNNNRNFLYNLGRQNTNKNFIEITNPNYSNNSYSNNFIIPDNSSGNINKNNLPINQKKSLNKEILKTDTNNKILITPNEENIKLIFNSNIFSKKLRMENHDNPIALRRKESPSPLAYTSSGNNLKYSIDKNVFGGEYKLHLKRPKRNISNQNNIINMNINNFLNIKNDQKTENDTKKVKKKIKGPEDLHFYYITVIQEGKQNESKFEQD